MQSGISGKTIKHYSILRTLGTGGTCKVKLGIDTNTGKNVAVKIMKPDLDAEIFQYVIAEVEAMKDLDHPNILRQIEYGKADYVKPSGTKEVTFIVLEIAEIGDLFDVVANSGAFSEDLTRFYMKRFLQGLQYCHNKGHVHRDIKIENCLLDKDFEIKINDFGFAAPTEGRDGSGIQKTKLGTECNMAPELLQKRPYRGESVDLFASAIVAFTMLSQHPPFHKASESDYYYKFIAKNHTKMFWGKHKASKSNPNYYSDEFVEWFNALIQPEASQRPSVEEALSHAWFQKPEMSLVQVQKELQSRLGSIRSAQDEARMQRRAEREANGATTDGRDHRTAQLQDEFAKIGEKFDITHVRKPMKKITGPFVQNGTYFFSSTSPDIIELLMSHMLTEAKNDHSVEKDKYKMRFTIQGKNLDAEDYEVDIQMKMMQYSDTEIFVEFQKLAGDQFYFLKHYKDLVQGSKVIENGKEVNIPGILTEYDNAVVDVSA